MFKSSREPFVTNLEPAEAEDLLCEAGFFLTHFGPTEAAMMRWGR